MFILQVPYKKFDKNNLQIFIIYIHVMIYLLQGENTSVSISVITHLLQGENTSVSISVITHLLQGENTSVSIFVITHFSAGREHITYFLQGEHLCTQSVIIKKGENVGTCF